MSACGRPIGLTVTGGRSASASRSATITCGRPARPAGRRSRS
jgi:hypothetical protein